MKTIEEKAKAYDEALERARKFYNDEQTRVGLTPIDLESIFPELKEPEDGKIREWLIEYFDKINDEIDIQDRGKIISWLEKQSKIVAYYEDRLDECACKYFDKGYKHALENQSNPTDINPSEFDLRLNKLLKQFEALPKEELVNCLSFYLNTVQNDGIYKRTDNPTDKVKPKFKVGDWTIYSNEEVHLITGFDDNGYFVDKECYIPFNCEGNMRLWTIDDAKDGDILAVDGRPFIYNGSKNEVTVGAYCGFNTEYKFSFAYNYVINQNIVPATKEQCNLLFQKMKEDGYEWDYEKKELEYNGEDYGIDSLWHAKNILEKTLGKVDGYQTDDGILGHKCAIAAVNKLYKQKSAVWSEEDERHRQWILECLVDGKRKVPEYAEDYQSAFDWLKSLRPNHWKPSKEQMKQLGWIAKQNKDNMIGKELISLYQDLRKLREE